MAVDLHILNSVEPDYPVRLFLSFALSVPVSLLQLLPPLVAGCLRTTEKYPNVTAVQANTKCGQICIPLSLIWFEVSIVAAALFIQTYPKLSWSVS